MGEEEEEEKKEQLPAGFLHCQVLEEASKGIALILYFQPFLLSHNFGSCYPFGFLLWLAFKDIRTWWCTLSLSPCIEQEENPMMTRPYETHQRRRRTMQKKNMYQNQQHESEMMITLSGSSTDLHL
ncbi:hypothetical protein SCA6_000232 [Theobroma cacao]